MEKMTQREFYTAIIAADVADNLKDFARERLEKLDNENKRRSSKPTKTQIANEPIKLAIRDLVLTAGESMTAVDVGEKLEISHNKATPLLKALCEEGILEQIEIKVPKKGKMKAYQAKDISVPVED